MPRYQVTLTYLITVDGATDKDHAEFIAVYDVGTNPYGYNDIEVEEVHIPKCCGLRAQTCVIDDGINSDVAKDYIETLKSFKDYLEEHKIQQEKILNTLKEKLN